MNLKKLGVVVVAVSAIGIGAASAQQGNPPAGQPGGRMLGRGGLLGNVAEIVADATGLTPLELRQQIRQGTTLAEIITANGGDVDAVTADIVAAVTEQVNQAVADARITQERADQLLADLEARVTDALNGEAPLGLGGLRGGLGRGEAPGNFDGTGRPFGRGGNRGGFERPGVMLQGTLPLLDAVQSATGLSLVDIGSQIRDGATLGEVVTNNGGDIDAVIAAALATVTEQANQAVTDGTITQAQADALLARLETFYQNAMEGQAVGLRGMI